MAERIRSQVVAFRVNKAERRQIEGKIRRSGLSQQAYLLRAALEEPIYVVGELKPILVELRGWGRNLNQLTVLAHTGRVQTVYLRMHGGVGQDLRGGKPAADRERRGDLPWRRAALSRRVSRPSAPWAGCSVTSPRRKRRWIQMGGSISPASTAGQRWLSRASWPPRICTARPAARSSTTMSSPSLRRKT